MADRTVSLGRSIIWFRKSTDKRISVDRIKAPSSLFPLEDRGVSIKVCFQSGWMKEAVLGWLVSPWLGVECPRIQGIKGSMIVTYKLPANNVRILHQG
jgi:hypothetical protein